jgi:hypothetical protein
LLAYHTWLLACLSYMAACLLIIHGCLLAYHIWLLACLSGDNFGSSLWSMMFDVLQKPKIFDATGCENWTPQFLATIVLDIDRHIQVDLGLRDRILKQNDNDNLPICKMAKPYFEKYVLHYKDDGHAETKAICTEWARKQGAS